MQEQKINNNFYMIKVARSFSFACCGIKTCFIKEINFKIHLCFTAIAVLLGICLHIAAIEWLIILMCIGLVLSLEMINTALEHLCNIVSNDYHAGIKIIKDISAGAVLISAFITAICGAVIFIPKIIPYILN